MNFDAILNQAMAFSSDGIGRALLNVAEVIYGFLYPANSGPAHPIEIPA